MNEFVDAPSNLCAQLSTVPLVAIVQAQEGTFGSFGSVVRKCISCTFSKYLVVQSY